MTPRGLTIEGGDRVKVDLGIEKRLDRGGDIVGMVVSVFTLAVAAFAMVVMVAGHGE